MGKNIVVFSDGTGQRGGVLFEEKRSNIYKLYRACKCSPDSDVDPSQQFAYYDPGIGTVASGIGVLGAIWQRIYNLVSQATGLGLTKNIIECYSEIIRNWVPGDRILLFGFSRGAYTVRCLAAVIAHCGIPTRSDEVKPLLRNKAACVKIAREAVTKVYQHVSSPKDTKYLEQRSALATQFRLKYASGNPEISNTFPHFVGVFDTVASLANYGSLIVVVAIALGINLSVSAILGYLFGEFKAWFVLSALIMGGIAAIAYLMTHLKVAFGLKEFPWWKTVHLTALRMAFYDTQLNQNVGWARHALAIDEHRADFDRVPWGTPKAWRSTNPGEPQWFEQIWFSGNHSDIGGSYAESESRLSDISLDWMITEATSVPNGLLVDRNVLKLYPSPAGMQHDETRSFVFRYANKINRTIKPDARLHKSVFERFKLPSVLNYDQELPYRPESLRLHKELQSFYQVEDNK